MARRRMIQRSAFQVIGLYARGLGARGRMTYAEVRGLRTLLATQLSRPAFRPDPQTLLEPVRVRACAVGAVHGGEVRGEWVERAGSITRERAVLLYVHGGAFVSGSPKTHRGLTSELAGRLGRSVFSLDYRLAPGHRFPAAADDVVRAYAWLLDSGVPAEAIVVAGDSAGGHLALGLSPRLRRLGLPLPAAVIALSPVVDPSMRTSAAWEREHGSDPVINSRAGRAAMRPYFRGTHSTDREVLLTADDLTGLPPILVQAAESEILVADARAYVESVRASGGNATLQTWPRQVHVFQVAFRISRSAREALDAVTEFVAEHAALSDVLPSAGR